MAKSKFLMVNLFLLKVKFFVVNLSKADLKVQQPYKIPISLEGGEDELATFQFKNIGENPL